MPIPKEEVKKLLEDALPGAQVAVDDLTGTMDHYRIIVLSDLFEGKTLVKRHQMINLALAEPLKGPLHALTIEAYTVAQWRSRIGE